MGYQALYRTWRPRQFKDLVGQKHITRTLQNAIVQEQFTHAYLFSGPRGTGKTSAAKIFANAINCEKAPSEEPCLVCNACRGILDGSISDVIEIDAASNTSVDDVREIRDKVKYAPSAVKYKVYIIDEVHMISVNAFNALLKTLEEPPKHVVFILATTEPHKIPLTIISRCQRFDFRPVSNQTIVKRLQEIVEKENFSVTEEALETIALNAEGSMRDSLSILDQAISYSMEHVDLEDVLAVTGSVSQDLLTKITQFLYEEDTNNALAIFDEMLSLGKEPSRFIFDLIYFFRDLLLYQSTNQKEDILERARVDESFSDLAAKVEASWLKRSIAQLNNVQQEIRWTNSPKIFVEIALLQIMNRSFTVEADKQEEHVEDQFGIVQQLSEKIRQLEDKLEKLSEQKPTQTVEKRPTTVRGQGNVFQSKTSYHIPYERIYRCLEEASRSYLNDAKQNWGKMLERLRQISAPAHAKVVESMPVACSEELLVVAFKYRIHCSLFMDNQDLVERTLNDIIGQSFEIIPIPYEDWQPLRKKYIQEQAETEKEDVKEEAEEKEKEDKEKGNPLVEQAQSLFGKDIVEIHE